jgi:hypothetical protein
VISTFSKVSEVTSDSFPEVKYAISFKAYQKYHFSTEKIICTSVSPFDDRLGYIWYFNFILFKLDGPRNVPQRIKTVGRAIELLPDNLWAACAPSAVRGSWYVRKKTETVNI